jgi:hypothetical protein
MGMTQMTSTGHRTLDRAPLIGDIVIIALKDHTLFDVVALDDLYGEMIYVRRHASEAPAQWVSNTFVKVVDDEDPQAWEG